MSAKYELFISISCLNIRKWQSNYTPSLSLYWFHLLKLPQKKVTIRVEWHHVSYTPRLQTHKLPDQTGSFRAQEVLCTSDCKAWWTTRRTQSKKNKKQENPQRDFHSPRIRILLFPLCIPIRIWANIQHTSDSWYTVWTRGIKLI